MEAYGSDDTVAVFQDALSNNVDSNKYDYLFLMDAGISSLVLSNLQNLTIPGSKLNTYGNTCDNRLGDDHILTLTKGLLAARIQLQTLSLRNHFISDIGFDLICSEIIEKRKLLELDLEGNNISGAGTGISGLRLDAADTSLTSLNLSCNPLITAAGMAIANALRTNHVLTKISLNNCGFNLNVIVAIATTLRQNVALEVLKLDRPLTDKLTKQEHGLDHLSRLMDGPLSRTIYTVPYINFTLSVHNFYTVHTYHTFSSPSRDSSNFIVKHHPYYCLFSLHINTYSCYLIKF